MKKKVQKSFNSSQEGVEDSTRGCKGEEKEKNMRKEGKTLPDGGRYNMVNLIQSIVFLILNKDCNIWPWNFS